MKSLDPEMLEAIEWSAGVCELIAAAQDGDEIKCPRCGDVIPWLRAPNGHRGAACKRCDMSFRE